MKAFDPVMNRAVWLHSVVAKLHGRRGLGPRLWCPGQLLCLALCMQAVLAALSWFGASRPLLVFGTLFFLVVAAARFTMWRGRRPGLASLLTGATLGALITCYLARGVWLSFTVASVYSKYYTTQLLLEMIAVVPVCAALGYIMHSIISVCSGAAVIVGSSYASWRAGRGLTGVLPAERLWRVGLYGLGGVVLIVLYRPLEVELCSAVARNCLVRAVNGGPPPFPVEAWLMRLQLGPSADPYAQSADCFMRVYESCRDHLVATGALVHRRFVFRHIVDGSADAAAVWRALFAAFPDNIYTTGLYRRGRPLVIDVYARPKDIPVWERFVRDHDVPNRREASQE